MQFAILVSVLVALLLSSFLLFTYTYSSFSLRSQRVLENIEAVNKGVEHMSDGDVNIDSLETTIGKTPVLLKSKFWGGFQLVYSRGGSGSTSFEKAALLGAGTGLDSPGILLENNRLPLVLAGDTRIEGDAYTPENIIKPGSIAGHYYAGNQLVYGRRYPSPEALPALNEGWRSYVREVLKFSPEAGATIVGLENISNSFFKERQVIFKETGIFLDHALSGNVMVISGDEIEVSAFAKLDQVLLVAPRVVFRTGFEGNAHVISEEAIVEENVRLRYPSSIVVNANVNKIPRPEDAYTPKIRIGQKSHFEGNILFLDSTEQEGHKNDILLAEDSFVEGNVYCEGYTELKGTVSGSLYTRYFVANNRGSLYINHICNGRVTTVNVKPHLGGILLAGKEKRVAAWLY